MASLAQPILEEGRGEAATKAESLGEARRWSGAAAIALRLALLAGCALASSAKAAVVQLSGGSSEPAAVSLSAAADCTQPDWADAATWIIGLFIIQPVGSMINLDISFLEAQSTFSLKAPPIWIGVASAALSTFLQDGTLGCYPAAMVVPLELIIGLVVVIAAVKLTKK
mmetsp:Transcript_78127/g.207345  ORF Transcript_78127/g.207345 Transcript_78127/m.207345 type:complete len:169 (-) Transcript_78127:39-545(-)